MFAIRLLTAKIDGNTVSICAESASVNAVRAAFLLALVGPSATAATTLLKKKKKKKAAWTVLSRQARAKNSNF